MWTLNNRFVKTFIAVTGEIRRKTDITLLDVIIAASSLHLDLPLATLNLKDFHKVLNLKIYETETTPPI